MYSLENDISWVLSIISEKIDHSRVSQMKGYHQLVSCTLQSIQALLDGRDTLSSNIMARWSSQDLGLLPLLETQSHASLLVESLAYPFLPTPPNSGKIHQLKAQALVDFHQKPLVENPTCLLKYRALVPYTNHSLFKKHGETEKRPKPQEKT